MHARLFLSAALLLAGATAAALAQQVSGTSTLLGTFKQWSAYSSNEADGKMCFIASSPTDSKYSRQIKSRDDVYFMITTIPARKIANEASTIIGYPFKDGSKVTVEIDAARFTMFTDKDNAWIESPSQEPELISAMRGGTKMTVQGTSRSGTLTTDSYSLSGVSAALDAILKACASEGATQ